MADKKPLYIENGRIQEYGAGDTISTIIAPGTGGGGGGGGPAWSNGSGERRFLIMVVGGGDFTGDPSAMLSASPSNNFYWATGAMLRRLVFTFPSPNIITGIAFSQNDPTENAVWSVAGSNDGVSFTTIISDFVLGGAPYGPYFPPTQPIYARQFTNTTPYRHYRLQRASGPTSNTPYVTQVMFKCEPIQ